MYARQKSFAHLQDFVGGDHSGILPHLHDHIDLGGKGGIILGFQSGFHAGKDIILFGHHPSPSFRSPKCFTGVSNAFSMLQPRS